MVEPSLNRALLIASILFMAAGALILYGVQSCQKQYGNIQIQTNKN